MTDKSREVERAKGESQEAFEKRVQKQMLAEVSRTEKMADAINPGISGEPKDVGPGNPVKGGKVSEADQIGKAYKKGKK